MFLLLLQVLHVYIKLFYIVIVAGFKIYKFMIFNYFNTSTRLGRASSKKFGEQRVKKVRRARCKSSESMV